MLNTDQSTALELQNRLYNILLDIKTLMQTATLTLA